jgi:hypothetical protein
MYTKEKKVGIASLVLGILGVIPMPIPFIGTVSSIIGLILGIVGKRKAREMSQPTGVCTAGIVLCIISLVLSVVWLIVFGSFAAFFYLAA